METAIEPIEPVDPLAETVDEEGVARLLNISVDAVRHRTKNRTLVCLPGTGETGCYPTFQLTRHGNPRNGIASIWQAWRSVDLDPWELVRWYFTPREELDGVSLDDYLRDGGDYFVALDLAEALVTPAGE